MGSQGLGYANDRFSGENLKKADEAAYKQYVANTGSQWLVFKEVHGLDADKVKVATTAVAKGKATPEQKTVVDSYVEANRQTFRADSFVPATMAVIYLRMFLYFMSIGGYKVVHVGDEITGGLAGPMEA